MRRFNLCAVALAASLGVANLAQADAIACDNFEPDPTGSGIQPSDACEIDPDIDNDSPEGQFLAGNWFGFDDWFQDSKDDDPGTGNDEGDNTLGFTLDGGLVSGDWSFSESIAGLDVMIVIKSGNQSSPNALISYLVSAQSGTYDSPFVNVQGQTQEISHISVWFREGGGEEMVEPGTLGLLGLGLLGLGAARRRRENV